MKLTPDPDSKPDPQPGPKPDPSPTPTREPGVKGWLKELLKKKIANLLLKIADKMLVALPGIIGSMVSFVLKSAAVRLNSYFVDFSNALGTIVYN